MSDTMRGIAAMILAMLGFAVGDTLVKLLGDSLPIGQMLFVRGVFATTLVTGYAWWTGALGDFAKMRDRAVVWRTLTDSACSVLFFLGLVRMSYADASAIGQFVPLMVMAGAALFLGEPVGWRRWSAALVGFAGVMLIIKPGTTAFQPSSLLILASMICVAARDLITRRMPHNLPTVLLTVVAAAAITVIGGLLGLFETWRALSVREIGMLGVCACGVLAGYVFIIVAMRTGHAATITPFRYSYMVFALASSVFVFRQMPDRWSLVGIGLVIGSGLYMLHRERVVGRRPAVDNPKARAA